MSMHQRPTRSLICPGPSQKRRARPCPRKSAVRAPRTCVRKRGMSAVGRLSLVPRRVGPRRSVGYWFGVRHHRSELGLRMGVYGALAWGLVQAAVLFVGFAPRRGLLGSRSVRVAVAVLLPLLFLGYLSYAAWTYVPFEQFSHGARAIACVQLRLGRARLRRHRRRQRAARLARHQPAHAAVVGDVGGLRRWRRGCTRGRHRLPQP